MKKLIAGLSISVASLAIGASVATAIILPRALKAKKALEAFVSSGGPKNSLKNKTKIKMLALGDSETAGANYLLQNKDYLSYADFLAQSFKNANREVNYKNYAVSGLRLSDFKKEVFQKPQIVNQLRDADLITITIGGNDILAYARYLDIPFELLIEFANMKKIDDLLKLNPNNFPVKNFPFNYQNLTSLTRNTINLQEDRKDLFQDVTFSWTKQESYNMVRNSYQMLKDIFLNNKPEALINLDPTWKDKIFALVKREIATLTRDLHLIAKNAQIIFLGHAMPFIQYPSEIINKKKASLNNLSVSELYEKLLNGMASAIKISTHGTNDYVDFYKIDDLKYFKEINKKFNDKDIERSLANLAMPNILDIHPSVIGHEKIAQSLFEILGKENGLTDVEIKKATQKSVKNNKNGIVENFERESISKTEIDFARNIFLGLNLFKNKQLFKSLAKPILDLMDKDYQVFIKELKNGIDDKKTSEKEQYQKAVYFLVKMVMNLRNKLSF